MIHILARRSLEQNALKPRVGRRCKERLQKMRHDVIYAKIHCVLRICGTRALPARSALVRHHGKDTRICQVLNDDGLRLTTLSLFMPAPVRRRQVLDLNQFKKVPPLGPLERKGHRRGAGLLAILTTFQFSPLARRTADLHCGRRRCEEAQWHAVRVVGHGKFAAQCLSQGLGDAEVYELGA